jgi:glycosyltransferase involved in cell wall biosynthesis
MPDLSVIIPSRNEMFTRRTAEDILANLRADTEIIIVLDGAWADPPLEQHDRVHILYQPVPIGQRAATNLAARVSTAQYVMKLDAHCAVDEGFDVKLIEAAKELGPDVTQIPKQINLHVFDWVCADCGNRTYQGPTPTSCVKCKSTTPQTRDIVWKPRWNRTTAAWRFDATLHFQYHGAGEKKQEGDICDVMTSLGACFFIDRQRYWELGGFDEDGGIWGQYGQEMACKSWLSGGRHVVNKRTWFAHCFRTQGGDFGFPYALSGSDVDKARKHARNLWLENKWPKQVRPLSWLIDKFAPLPDWHDASGAEALAKVRKAGELFEQRQQQQQAAPIVMKPLPATPTIGIAYYTDNRLDPVIMRACQQQLRRAAGDAQIACVSLARVGPEKFDDVRILLPLERGYLTMFKQILAGLEVLDTDLAFLCEHDVLYHSSHFAFRPPRADRYYYNQHVWKVSSETGQALHYLCSQTSGLCASRELLVQHYRLRVAKVEQHGFSRQNGFEPGTRKLRHGGFDDIPAETWMSELPNIDIRHGQNLTPSRWKKEQFRNQKYTAGWTEADHIPGWGSAKGRFADWLQEVTT